MAGTTIKLQTNIPVIGTLEYADYITSKNTAPDGKPYADQISLRGKWDGAGDGRMYLHLSIENELQKLKVIGLRQSNGNYPLLVKEPKIKVTKVEQGASKKTIVELLGHAGELAQAVQDHTQQQTAPSLYPPASTPQRAPVKPDASIVDLNTTMQDCVDIARKIFSQKGLTEEFSLATISTALFEQRCRLGLYGATESVPF